MELELAFDDGGKASRCERSYLVSGHRNTTAKKLTAVKMKASHLCQRQPTVDAIKPQIRGPIVLPPLMKFMYTPIRFARSCKK